jgi:hypothetical protein
MSLADVYCSFEDRDILVRPKNVHNEPSWTHEVVSAVILTVMDGPWRFKLERDFPHGAWRLVETVRVDPLPNKGIK